MFPAGSMIDDLFNLVYDRAFLGVHSRVGDREGCGYPATGLGSHGWPAWARVMASRMVRPWLRADVRYELIKHHRSRVWSLCQYPDTRAPAS
jgi:hypothetical protein